MRTERKNDLAPAVRKATLLAATTFAFAASVSAARAEDPPLLSGARIEPVVSQGTQAPAPLGVFGVGLLNQGQWAVSYAPVWSRLAGSQIGTSPAYAEYIIQNVYSYHTPGSVGTPKLLRMVPSSFEFFGQSVSAAYCVTKDVTLVAATTYWEKWVDMYTYHAGTGPSALLGTSTGHTDGIGDTLLAGVWRVYHDTMNQLNLNIGFSLPTGDTTANQTLFVPKNGGSYSYARAFYGMQPGSGTLDFMPGLAYSGVLDQWSWGLAYRGRFPMDSNPDGWRYGAWNDLTGWGGYTWLPGFETTLRLDGMTQGRIGGFDPLITGFAQGANPYFYGGQWVSIFGGVNLAGKYFNIPKANLSLEVGLPVYQNLNGPQGARAVQANMALTYKF